MGGGSLRAVGGYSYPPSEDKAFGGMDHWAAGAAAAEVEVDLDTGEVRVARYAAVADVGRAIHRQSTIGQVEGGAALGLGGAMFEELVYAEGELLNADAFQYRLPTMRDYPPFQTFLIENGEGPGPFGAKGMAQTSLPCVAPAIGNAIYAAIGVPVRSTPFSPEKILRALGALPSGASAAQAGPSIPKGTD
jgi:CO/xanthine dehydrogenase Mo-binding subunit